MDAETFKQRVVPLYKGLYSTAVAILGDRDDAADAVQECMERLWQSRDKLDKLSSLEAYAFATLRNCSLDALRRRKHQSTSPPEDTFEPPGSDAADVEAIAMIVENLPPNYKEVIKLSVYDGRSPEEIAKITGHSAANIRQLLSRGRRKIKELYSKFIAS